MKNLKVILTMSDNILAALNDVFCDVFDSDSIQIQLDYTSANITGWDSLAQIRLIVAAEQKFSIQFSSIEVSNLRNVGEFVDLIKAKLGQ